MPNLPETLVAFLATASIGAIWSSCSPDFGAAQRGRPLRADRAQGALLRRRLPLQRARLRPHRRRRPAARRDADGRAHGRPALPRSRARPRRACATRSPGPSCSPPGDPGEIEFEQVPFDHPLWVLYSSGTTGLPKAIVQGHGGILARAAEEAQPAPRRAGGRSRLLVHDHRLDDVELPRRRAAHRGLDRPLRRQPRSPRHGRALGSRRARRDRPASGPAPATSPPA